MKIAKINRMKAQRARRYSGWCDGCDRNHTETVGKHRKCSVCGYKTYRKKKKIVVPEFELDM